MPEVQRRLVRVVHGRIETDIDFIENRVRPVKHTANNALFAGHDEGACAWSCIASLNETCKMNGVESCAWLKNTLGKIAADYSNSHNDELLPWNFKPPPSRNPGAPLAPLIFRQHRLLTRRR